MNSDGDRITKLESQRQALQHDMYAQTEATRTLAGRVTNIFAQQDRTLESISQVAQQRVLREEPDTQAP
eukprot:9049472-Karenia_brevis.AAC.1